MPKTHTLHLHPEPFARIVAGQKTCEYRLYDEKRRSYKVGDILTFVSRESGQSQACIITQLITEGSFQELLKHAPKNDLKVDTAEGMRAYYTAAEEKENGTLAIFFQKSL
jgi:ASC-1-like (ASCH) protein